MTLRASCRRSRAIHLLDELREKGPDAAQARDVGAGVGHRSDRVEIDQEGRHLRLLSVHLVEQEVVPAKRRVGQRSFRVFDEEVVAQAGLSIEGVAIERQPESCELVAEQRLLDLRRRVGALAPAVVICTPPEHSLRLGAERDSRLPGLLEERICAPRLPGGIASRRRWRRRRRR